MQPLSNVGDTMIAVILLMIMIVTGIVIDCDDYEGNDDHDDRLWFWWYQFVTMDVSK